MRLKSFFLILIAFVCYSLDSSSFNVDIGWYLPPVNQVADKVWNAKSCSSEYDSEKAFSALAEANKSCAYLKKDTNLATYEFKNSLEDKFFELLSKQESRELQCASQFSRRVGINSGIVNNKILPLLKSLREARQAVVQNSQKLAQDPDVTNRVCPVKAGKVTLKEGDLPEFSELKPDPMLAGLADKHYEYCRAVMANRMAYSQILATIPLSTAAAVHDLAEKYANLPEGSPELAKLENNLTAETQKAYLGAEKQLTDQADGLIKDVNTKGGQNLDSGLKYMLISDPRMVQKVIDQAGGGKDLASLACRADARYGRGSEALSDITTKASVVATVLSTPVRAAATAIEVAQVAAYARTLGAISLNAMRALEWSALGAADTMSLKTVTSCVQPIGLKFKANSTDASGACVSAPTVQQLDQDSCILQAALAASGLVPKAAKLGKSLAQATVGGAKSVKSGAAGLAQAFVKPPPAATVTKYKTIEMQKGYLGESSGSAVGMPDLHTVYMNAADRESVRVFVKEGKLYDSEGKLVNSNNSIYVMDGNGNFYVTDGVDGAIHHSSFLAGGNVAAAGHIRVVDGQITMLSRNSGHYKPPRETLDNAMSELQSQGVDTSSVKTFGAVELPGVVSAGDAAP